MDQFWNQITTIVLAIIGVAIIAVIVSRNANTSSVISAASGGLAQDLSAATAPVTGATSSNLGNLGFTGGQPLVD